jgi:hypothetical protein
VIIAEQVFEHIKHPDVATRNVFKMLKPGGVFIISTPFLVKIHAIPLDCYRWTMQGVQILLESAGFSVLETGSWGNRQCLMSDVNPGITWTWYVPYLHSLKNEPHLPMSIWAFAQKPRE